MGKQGQGKYNCIFLDQGSIRSSSRYVQFFSVYVIWIMVQQVTDNVLFDHHGGLPHVLARGVT